MSALVMSRLDYCNSLLASATQAQIDRLQRAQNHAARVVLRKKRRDHATPLLQELHWLPVKYRCQFKIATLAYHHFEGSLPKYLSDVLETRKTPILVRSSSLRRLHPPRKPKRITVGGRSFAHIAPTVWNSLPAELKAIPSLSEFKAKLKTHFFRQHLDQ